MYPELSVIIPTYNRRVLVREALASVMAQHVAPLEVDCVIARKVACEIIVVDDGSTDGTAEELDRIADEVKAERPNSIRMSMRVVHSENRGAAAARNAGVAVASAPLIAFLDSDDLWLPHKLERQLAFMHAHPEYAIAQTQEIWMRGGRRVNPGLRHRKRAGDIFIESLRTCLISPSAVILRTALFHELGGFDERMVAAEDYDLWLRVLVKHKVGLLAEPLVIRRAGHLGQLSAAVPAIDRFRILALLKLMSSDDLDPSQWSAVRNVIMEKCGIYAQGLRRRGREVDATTIAEIGALANTAGDEPRRAALRESVAELLAIIAVEASGAVPESSGITCKDSGGMQKTFAVKRDRSGTVTETGP